VTPIDIAPTVLHVAGLPVEAEMAGQVISAMLPPDAASRPIARERAATTAHRPASPVATPDPVALARLQALGYVGAVRTSLSRINLGESLYRRGRFAQAEREFRAAIEAQPGNVAARLWLAKTLRDQGRLHEALRAYQQVVRIAPASGEALVEGVDVAVAANLLDEARALATAKRSGAAPHAAARTARAIVAQAAGDARGAERELRAALAVEPTAFDPLVRLFDLLVSAPGGAPQALVAVERATSKATASPRHLALLGAAHLAVRDAPRAEAALRRALALAPDSSAVRIDLARALVMQDRAEQALETLGPAPPSAERSMLLAAAYSKRNQWRQAADAFRTALNLTPPTPALLNGLGWAELQLGRPREASEQFTRSLALDPNQPEIRRLLAQTQASAGSRPR
jgi:tetratricopeptide (TPR) repeat protein